MEEARRIVRLESCRAWPEKADRARLEDCRTSMVGLLRARQAILNHVIRWSATAQLLADPQERPIWDWTKMRHQIDAMVYGYIEKNYKDEPRLIETLPAWMLLAQSSITTSLIATDCQPGSIGALPISCSGSKPLRYIARRVSSGAIPIGS